MTSGHEQDVGVRRADERDVEAILDLLTHYDLERRYFEPWYYDDPKYRPEQSWVVELGGKLVAHLRVFDRLIRVSGVPVRVAGIGNVVTAREARGRGYAGRLLHAAVAQLSHEPFAYSLLWTHLPRVYASQGWAPIADEVVQGRISTPVDSTITVHRFEEADLPEVARLYDRTNAERTGSAIRSLPYWRAQRTWLGEAPDDFLVARRENGSLAGYIRIRRKEELRELGIEPGDWEAGRALLAAVQKRHGSPLVGPLPSSLRDVFRPEERKVLDDPGLMGRTLNLNLLIRSLEPAWTRRVSERSSSAFVLATDAGPMRIDVQREGVGMKRAHRRELTVGQREFGRLLFHGMEAGRDWLFPPQDFVIWGTDRF